MIDDELQNKERVFVAGSTGGIGLAVAKVFLENGSSVILHGRNQEKLIKIVGQLKSEYPGRVYGFSADITVASELKGLISKINETFTVLDTAIFCVGNGKTKGGMMLDQNEWDEVMHQNFFGNIITTNHLLPLLRKSKNASICYIGSIAGLEYSKAPISYSVAKSALNTYAKCISKELATENIRVNIVHPGNIFFVGGRWEELRNNSRESVEEYIKENVPQGRFGKPDDIAKTVFYLSSKSASFITGSSIVIDGGQVRHFS